MRIFKHKRFHLWAESKNLTDIALIKAVKEIKNGLYEANLGSGLYKKRIASTGKGKSGSYRTLIAFGDEQNTFFVYGFAKNARTNIDEIEKKIYRQLAKDFLSMDETMIKKMLDKKNLFEVKQ